MTRKEKLDHWGMKEYLEWVKMEGEGDMIKVNDIIVLEYLYETH